MVYKRVRQFLKLHARGIKRIISLLLVLALVASLALGSSYISLFAPFSGSVWSSVQTSVGPIDQSAEMVESPYGSAEVNYDENGVPHIEAENEKALYYAVGYVQAKDRLFQMDLYRRRMEGSLSEVFGNRTFESDKFNTKMDFEGAAQATWENIEDKSYREGLKAFSEGVNTYIDNKPLPLEFKLLDYRPEEWEPVDTILISKQISWGLTGNFWDIKKKVISDKLGREALELYPRELDHNSTILGRAPDTEPGESLPKPSQIRNREVSIELANWLDQFSSRTGWGSNNWVIGREHTKTGEPLLANDPHLLLTSPPTWYEMHIKTDGMNVRGVALPGSPNVVIGENENLAWGFTNTGVDVLDLYTYSETENGKYLYKKQMKEFETETKIVEVKDGNKIRKREVEVKKSVHGPVIEREGDEVAVAWTGLTATRQSVAIQRFNKADNITEFREAQELFDAPAQNTVVIDHEGNTMYYPVGKFPIRRVDGKRVPGNTVFNGSAGEGEWEGFEPYGQSTWEGFIPLNEIPRRTNFDYLATANQRVIKTSEYEYYLGDSGYFADPYRGMRIYEMIETKVENGEKMGPEYMKKIQRDTYSKRADFFVPQILENTDEMPPDVREEARKLEDWDRRMNKTSENALLFSIWLQKYRNQTFKDEFYSEGLDKSYYPKYWVLQNLDSESEWFDDKTTDERETRDDIIARAMEKTVEEIEKEGYEDYGDYNVLKITHPFDLGFLNYPKKEMDGGPYTVFNVRTESNAGSSWRMISSISGTSYGVIPGGNSGNYFSDYYSDQFSMWAEGGYKEMNLEVRGKKKIIFEDSEEGDE